jgi:hypothetical protein
VEWLVAVGLGLAAGTNAYIPLLITGVLARWTNLVSLPDSWQWLESGWVLSILGVLIGVEFLSQRVPGLATADDVLQTLLRPTSAGIVVSAQGAGSALVTDWGAWFQEGHWVPVAVAAGIALALHLARSVFRIGADVATAGLAGGVLAGVDEGASVAFSLSSWLLPLLVPLLTLCAVIAGWWLVVRYTRRSRAHAEP